jgi:mono/diheme cytochrome c family protein
LIPISIGDRTGIESGIESGFVAKENTMQHIRKAMRALALAATAIWGAGAALAQATPDAAKAIEQGRALYMANGCFSCHGTLGHGGGERSGAPKLAPEPYPYEAFRALVRTPRETMPRLDEKFVSDEQLRLIHRFLASVEKGPAAKDIPALR